MKTFSQPRWLGLQETHVYAFLCFIFCLLYLTIGFIIPSLGEFNPELKKAFFGFSQLSRLGIFISLSVMILPVVVFAGIRLLPDESDVFLFRIPGCSNGKIFRLGISLLLGVVFFLFRNEFINLDAILFTGKFIQDVPLKGAYATHDEMWEFYIHSRFWFYTHHYLGWSVKLSYQVLSSVAGSVFIFLLLSYWSMLCPYKPSIPFILCMCGGYMQIFFGDTENYTLTAVWIMGYFLASALFSRKKVSIILPSILLAIAITFHLLCLFLVPSWAYLWVKAWKREKKHLSFIAIGAIVSIIVSTLLFFHFNSLPLRNLWFDSHLFGHGGHVLSNLVKPSMSYYFDILNLLFLLVPVWILIIPLVMYHRIELDELNIHLILASGFMMIFLLSFKAGLGVYQDWNLYANIGIPVSLLIWRNGLSMDSQPQKPYLLYYLGWLYFIHSYSWIISNHYNPS